MVAWRKRAVQKRLAISLVILLTAGIVLPAKTSATGSPQGPGKRQPVRLFGTIEFRSDLKSLPQWRRVLSVVERQLHEYKTCKSNGCSPAAKSWRHVIQQSEKKSPMETLKSINALFNKWPYRLDIEVYGASDYWASPNEFLKLSGDCEDYSIVKFFALVQLGFKAEDMRIVIVKDRIRNIAHAVLAVYMNDTAFILDNLSNMVLPHSKYQHYIPQYSVNGVNRWAHIRPIGKQGY